MCGLPREAMTPQKNKKAPRIQQSQQTVLSKSSPPLLVPIVVGLLIALGAGFGVYKVLQSNHKQPEVATTTPTKTSSATPSATATPTPSAVPVNPQALVSETATNAQLISQGEKILIAGAANPQKTQGAAAFAKKNWNDATAKYQQAATADRNDPESTIYLNNAKAKKAGNPLTMAVVVPIATSADTAKEVLRGVAQYQDRFNQSPTTPGRLLEVVIVNDTDPQKAASLAQDLVNSPDVLGVLGHGVDNGSQQAIAIYQQAGLAVLSPISTSITPSGGQSSLKTISLNDKAQELLGNYLKTVGQSLAKYASKKKSPPSAVVFYNSDSPYSQQLKQEVTAALSQVNGKAVKEIDITGAGFNPQSEMTAAKKAGANVAILALSKNKVDQAIAIAKANTGGGAPLQLMGGNELYTPTILQQGGDAINGIVLAVPWSSQPDDPFAKQAASIWKGRVSWRTATAYDATQALVSAFNQNPTRSGVDQLLKSGVNVSGTATDFNVLNDVPLVQAVKGFNGPPGSKYQFDPVQ